MKIDKFQLSMIRGAIAKSFVVKHYRGGKMVVTKYPDMKGIVASEKQKVRRRLFKKAVAYAQKVYANPTLKEEKRRLLRRPRRLFQAIMKEWFRTRREKEAKAARRMNWWKENVERNGGLQKQVTGAATICQLNDTHTISFEQWDTIRIYHNLDRGGPTEVMKQPTL